MGSTLRAMTVPSSRSETGPFQVGALGEPRLLAHDGHHRLVVQLRVVETVPQVDGARPGGGHATAHLTGELGVPARHERGHHLVSRLDELRVAVRPVESPPHAVDAVAGVSEDAVDAPLAQAIENVVCYLLPATCYLLPHDTSQWLGSGVQLWVPSVIPDEPQSARVAADRKPRPRRIGSGDTELNPSLS